MTRYATSVSVHGPVVAGVNVPLVACPNSGTNGRTTGVPVAVLVGHSTSQVQAAAPRVPSSGSVPVPKKEITGPAATAISGNPAAGSRVDAVAEPLDDQTSTGRGALAVCFTPVRGTPVGAGARPFRRVSG